MKKKWIAGFTILTMTAVLTACNGATNPPAENTDSGGKIPAQESVLPETDSSETESVLSEAETSSEEASSQKSDSTPANGIRPEFQEAMDSCEEFFDEYVDFMKEYSEASSVDALGMIDDYTNYLQKYTDTMKKMEALDDGELSTKEALYYAEVTGRINQKLLEVVE